MSLQQRLQNFSKTALWTFLQFRVKGFCKATSPSLIQIYVEPIFPNLRLRHLSESASPPLPLVNVKSLQMYKVQIYEKLRLGYFSNHNLPSYPKTRPPKFQQVHVKRVEGDEIRLIPRILWLQKIEDKLYLVEPVNVLSKFNSRLTSTYLQLQAPVLELRGPNSLGPRISALNIEKTRPETIYKLLVCKRLGRPQQTL